MTTLDEESDVGERTSRQGFVKNRAGPRKATRKGRSQISEDELSTGNEDLAVSVITSTRPKKGKPANTPRPTNRRSQTVPSQKPAFTPNVSTPTVSINSYGPGTTTNTDIGNIKNSIISNVGNNNSRNYFQPMSRSTYDGYGY